MAKAFKPKIDEIVIAMPKTPMRIYTLIPVAIDTGTANIARPTPNQAT